MSRIWMVNGLLALALMVVSMGIWEAWQQETVLPGALQDKGKTVQPFHAPPETDLLSIAEYGPVAERNLFSPDRTAPAAAPEAGSAGAVQEEARIDGEKIILYGVILFGDYKTALVNDPENQSGAEQRKWVKEGDRIGNLTVREIRQDRMALADEGASYRVLLYDPQKVRDTKAAAKIAPPSQPKVVSVGDIPAGAKSVKASSSPASTRTKNATTSDAAPVDNEGYQTIETPFGEIKKKIK